MEARCQRRIGIGALVGQEPLHGVAVGRPRLAGEAFQVGADHVRGRVAQMALRDVGDVVDEVRRDAERGGEAEHGFELGVVEPAVDECHDGGEANGLDGQTGFGRERLQLVRLAGARPARSGGSVSLKM